MTPTRAKELLPIITAFAEGKEIQWRTEGGSWIEMPVVHFDDCGEYRIKPEPREPREWWYVPGIDTTCDSRAEAERKARWARSGGEIIHVREVLDPEPVELNAPETKWDT